MVKKHSILILEDTPQFADGLRKCLSDGGYEILPIHDNVNKAIKTIKTTKPDGIVIDIQLKGRLGIDLIKFLKPDEGEPEITDYDPAVIVLSSFISERIATILTNKGYLSFDKNFEYDHTLVLNYFNDIMSASISNKTLSNPISVSKEEIVEEIKLLVDKKLFFLGFDNNFTAFDHLRDSISEMLNSPTKNPQLSQIYDIVTPRLTYDSANKSIKRLLNNTWQTKIEFRQNYSSDSVPKVKEFIYIIANELRDTNELKSLLNKKVER